MGKPNILLQLDSDPQASAFDAVVAVDAGVEHLLQYGGVNSESVTPLVHGAMFTRGPADLHQTAIFIGGSEVVKAEAIFKRVASCFFGPMRVSVMLDPNGANTTAVAAVLAAARHVPLAGAQALVLAGTGPVGQRAARLLAGQGSAVRLASRRLDRAEQAVAQVKETLNPPAEVQAVQTSDEDSLRAALDGSQIVIAAGAAGVCLLPAAVREEASSLQVVIDLNAVPPLGIAGTEVNDQAVERGGVRCYGAIGVGGTKMKIHKEAVRRLFQTNEQLLDAEQILAIGQELMNEPQ